MNTIKVAVLQFYDDHRYMPWGDPSAADQPRVGLDAWTVNEADRANLMRWLTGENPLKKSYMQVPEKSRPDPTDMTFLDPWKQPYIIGLDRNLDGMVVVANTGVADWDGKTVMEKVLVFSPGPPGENKPMKTFDVKN